MIMIMATRPVMMPMMTMRMMTTVVPAMLILTAAPMRSAPMG